MVILIECQISVSTLGKGVVKLLHKFKVTIETKEDIEVKEKVE